MGLGMFGALGGLGEAGMQIGNQMMQGAIRSDLMKEQQEYLRQERERVEQIATEKRKNMITEMNKISDAKAAPDLANLSKAREIYSGLEGADRDAGLQAVADAEGRVRNDSKKLSGQEIAKAGLLSGAIEGKDYVGMLGRTESTSDRLANAVLLQQLKNEGRLENTEKRETMRNERAEEDRKWKDETGRGLPSAGRSGGRVSSGSSQLSQEKWDVAKTEKFIKGQPQFYMFENEIGGKKTRDDLAYGTFNSLAKVLGGEKAKAVMQQAFDNATLDAEAGEGDFKTNYKERLSAITKRLSGGK